jgi:hypothetical protein
MRYASPGLAALEAKIYDALVHARDQGDQEAAEKLLKVWQRLPSDRPNPLRAGPKPTGPRDRPAPRSILGTLAHST